MTKTDALEELETVYTSPDAPNPKDARLVLAFILSPTEAFCDGSEVAKEILQAARCEAAENWKILHAHDARDEN